VDNSLDVYDGSFTDDITKDELYKYLYTNKIDPLDLLCDLINGYHQTHLVFDDIRS
jgi:hypothetical protein